MSNVTRLPTKTPDAGNVEVTEHLNVDQIQTGNSDIPVPEWTPTEVVPGSTPIGEYPPRGGVQVERRRNADARAWHLASGIARDSGLALLGFIGLVAILSFVSLLDSFINAGVGS